MGSTSSKPARKLPKSPPWAGARTPSATDPHPTARPLAKQPNTAAEPNSIDPHFMTNLSRLGQVRVDHPPIQRVQPVTDVNRMFAARTRSEYEASAPHTTHNRLLSTALSNLLDERKSATTRRDVERLAKKYDIDVAKLDSLSRFINSPSVSGGTSIRTVAKDGQEEFSIKAIWVEPTLK